MEVHTVVHFVILTYFNLIVTGPWSGSLGASFVSADWRVRVFWSSGVVNRPSEHLYVYTIPLYRCIDRSPHYTPFYSQAWLACHSKTCDLAASPEELSSYGSPRWGPPGPWTFSDNWTAWGIPHTKKVSYKNWESYNLGVNSILVTRFHCTQQLRNTGRSGLLSSPSDFCWFYFPRWSYQQPLGLNSFAEKLCCG